MRKCGDVRGVHLFGRLYKPSVDWSIVLRTITRNIYAHICLYEIGMNRQFPLFKSRQGDGNKSK